MGGLDTEVTEETTDILLETATFEPGRTSRTSRNLGLISESSMRYERGVDDHGIEERSAAAAALIVEVAGGHVSGSIGGGVGIVDEWPNVSEEAHLTFRIPRFNAMMGADISRDFIVGHARAVWVARWKTARTPTRLRSRRRRSAPTCRARSTSTRRCCASTAWTRSRPRFPAVAAASAR